MDEDRRPSRGPPARALLACLTTARRAPPSSEASPGEAGAPSAHRSGVVAVMVPQRGSGGLSQRPGTTGPLPGPLQSQGVPPHPLPSPTGQPDGSEKVHCSGRMDPGCGDQTSSGQQPPAGRTRTGLCKPLTLPAPLCPTRGVSLPDSAAGPPRGEPLGADRQTA